MGEHVSREDVRRRLHELAEFRLDEKRMDEVLLLIDGYAISLAQDIAREGSTPLTDAWVHAVTSMAHKIQDQRAQDEGDSLRLLQKGYLDALNVHATAIVADVQRMVDDYAGRLVMELAPLLDMAEDARAQHAVMLERATRENSEVMAAIAAAQAAALTGDRSRFRSRPLPPLITDEVRAEVKVILPATGKTGKGVKGSPGCYFNEDGTITCRECGQAKDPMEFYKDKRAQTGRKSACRTCERSRVTS